MKRQFSKLYRRIYLHKVHHRIIILLLLAFLGLISVFGTQNLLLKKAIATNPTTPLICSSTQNLNLEQLSGQGKASYERGRFDEAIDCWQKAVAGYSQIKNETEIINNKINLAQAEQALGLFPRACNTLIQIYGEEDCTKLLQDEKKRIEEEENNTQDEKEKQEKDKPNKFSDILRERADSSAKITGLRSLGNVLRGLGELDLSHQVLLLSLEKAQPQEKAAILLDLGNTRRTLSNKEQDFYNRTQERQNLICAIVYAYNANEDAYYKAEASTNSISNSESFVKLQAQLNRLSLLLDLKDWRNKIKEQTNKKNDVFDRLFAQRNEAALKIIARNFWNKVKLCDSTDFQNTKDPSAKEIRDWFNQQLSKENPLFQPLQMNNLQQQIEQLPLGHAALYTRLNFAKNLMRINELFGVNNNVEAFLNRTIDIIEKAKKDNGYSDIRVESYALGYLGKLYQDKKDLESAETKTRRALLLAQSIPAEDIMYQWQWQLGRIYKCKLPPRSQVQTKGMQDNLKQLNDARSIYEGTFKTLQSLRRELATGNPDAQFYFQDDIESIYREYVDLLLWDETPSTNLLSKAREVISSLQAVELENFLRQACPEYNVQQIDQIVDDDKQAKRTAFLSPIVLKDRIEVILKLPTYSTQKNSQDTELKHYRTLISQTEVEQQIRQLQRDLEEEYTFDAVTKEANNVYKWLLKDAEQFLQSKGNDKINTLVFALDTTLRNIPLAALVYNVTPEGKPEYLIEKYAIALVPRLEIPTVEPLQSKELKILAAGLSEPKSTRYQREFPKLRFVEKELDVIEEASRSRASVSKLPNDKFNTKEFQRKLNSSVFPIVHLATHGEFSSSPENTFILASDKKIVVNEVGDVFRTQAQNQPEPIELLVLSACETAAGDKRATLGISGVAVRAGARSAIASLWTLDDEVSVEFAKEFYNQLMNPNLTKSQALKEAQIKLMKDLKYERRYEHPRYWAPYILLGNWL
ncbi:MAG: CHAT domain-containing protein [Heteroscytonema crispum UTEX LB 1556]